MPKVRVRIAPSPTGLFHLGSLRTALTNYSFARKERGIFIVRVEDTDQARLVPEAIPDMLSSLRWSGIEIDEGATAITNYQLPITNKISNPKYQKNQYDKIKKQVVQRGNFGPYIQSERLDIYKRYADELLRKKLAYPCFCSAKRLEEMRKNLIAKGLPPKYDRHCLMLTPEEVKSRMAKEPFVLRLKIPATGKTAFTDLVKGKIVMENKLLDDPILIKSDGFPTYHFAVVVDDHLMRISHIFRGEEWIPSTPKHILIYQAFDWPVPAIGHLTNILNMKGGKLSKRDGDVSVSDFRKKGYLPEAVINFVALLGWNPKTTQEIFSLSELIKEFDVKKLNKAAPRFDQKRLEWFSAYYIRQKSAPELSKLCEPYLKKEVKDKNLIKKIVTVQQPRMHTLSEVNQDIDFMFKLPEYPKQLLHWKDMGDRPVIESLRKALQIIEKIPTNKFSLANLEKPLMAAAGIDRGPFLWPLRAALTGQKQSPSPFECAWM
ncbi:MAG: glutamate--tRNA ligase, partial [Candidatus Moraniibacteriota bacterium]